MKKKSTWGGARANSGGVRKNAGRPKNASTEKLRNITVKESLVNKFKALRTKQDLSNSQLFLKMLNKYEEIDDK